MDITDRIYLLYPEKQYRGDVPNEIGELKILKQDTLITLAYNDGELYGYGIKFFAYADGYFDLGGEGKASAETEIDPDIRFFYKKLKVLRKTARFYKDEDVEGKRLRGKIEATIRIDRYKNTIDISVAKYLPDLEHENRFGYGLAFQTSANLKKVTLFN